VQGKDEGYIKKIAIKNGLKTLKQNGIEKALQGITTIDEVLRVTFT
jgi:type IV pilus assembly protein PilB